MKGYTFTKILKDILKHTQKIIIEGTEFKQFIGNHRSNCYLKYKKHPPPHTHTHKIVEICINNSRLQIVSLYCSDFEYAIIINTWRKNVTLIKCIHVWIMNNHISLRKALLLTVERAKCHRHAASQWQELRGKDFILLISASPWKLR